MSYYRLISLHASKSTSYFSKTLLCQHISVVSNPHPVSMLWKIDATVELVSIRPIQKDISKWRKGFFNTLNELSDHKNTLEEMNE